MSPATNLLGLPLAMMAASIWGVSFVIPVLLPDRSPLEITVARYLAFGAVSCLILLRGRRSGMPALTNKQWIAAFTLALTGYLVPYLFLVSAIQTMGAAVPTLVMGTSPVAVALYANLRRREFPMARLLPSLAAIFTGLAMANLGRHGLTAKAGDMQFCVGLAESVAALASFTWFVVDNLTFMKAHPRISPLHWASAVGTVLGGVSILLIPVALVTSPAAGPRALLPYALLAGGVLGIGSSWLGGVLWNRACAMLPATLAGQLIVFWPISGLVLIFLIEQRLPSLVETVGILLTLAGVVLGIWNTRQEGAPGSKKGSQGLALPAG